MEADTAEVEDHARSVRDEWSTVGITEVQSGSYGIRGGHRIRGLGRNWVTPWMTMSNASTCPYHCEAFELRMV